MNKLFATAAAIFLAGAANAAVVNVSISSPVGGTWTNYVGAGPIGDDNFDDNNTVYTMDERQNVALGSSVAVAGGSIAAGTKVASHYVWFDPKKHVAGVFSVTFSREILGVIITRAGLIASNAALGLAGVTYLDPPLTGLEKNTDTFSFSGKTLNVNWHTSTPGDHIRVITAAVPVPAAGGLLALGLAGLAALRRRRKAA